MDLQLKGRGAPITDRLRQVAEHKLASIERLEPRLTRVEVVVISEAHRGGIHRVEAAAGTPRKTFRAHADAAEAEIALDLVAGKLERQIREHHKKRRARLLAGASRVKSAQTAPERTGPGAEGANQE